MKKSKTVLAIYSTPTKNKSNSGTLLDAFCEGVESQGVKVEKIFLYDMNLPYFDYKNRKAEPCDETCNLAIKRIEHAMLNYQGIVISSPVWNFSVPAILKNLLDRISYFGRVYKHEYSMKKQPNLGHLHCYYIFTTGAPWYGWLFNQLAYWHTKLTMWYFGGKNHGLMRAHSCGNGAKSIVQERPHLLEKAKKRGKWFAKKYIG